MSWFSLYAFGAGAALALIGLWRVRQGIISGDAIDRFQLISLFLLQGVIFPGLMYGAKYFLGATELSLATIGTVLWTSYLYETIREGGRADRMLAACKQRHAARG